MLEKIAKQYLRLVDYFVPGSMVQNREAANQARMFLISHTMGPVLGNSVPLALYLLDPTPGMDVFWLTVSITGFWVFPFLLKRGFDYDKLVITSVLNLNFCIFWSCYYNGGVSSPTLPWVLIIPILSFFYIGGEKRLQTTLLSIFGGCFATFLAFYLVLSPLPNDIPEYALISLGIVSTVAALAYVATMAIYYSRIFDAGVELENEVRRRRQVSDDLREAVSAADRAGRMKAEFLARMSHELRTPLNAVIGYSQILKDDALDAKNNQMVSDIDKIHDAGQYLLRLINMILDLSKIEAGRMQFRVETAPLAEIVGAAVDGAAEAMRANNNKCELVVSEDVGRIETDRERLVQIVDAILQNAAEHTLKGKVTIRCAAQPMASGLPGYRITISDTGNGIAPERLATLFQTLIDTRDASASKYGGTGLNLTVTKKLAEAMGCTLTAESTLGEGSCFTIDAPASWHVSEDKEIEHTTAGKEHAGEQPAGEELVASAA